MSLPIPSTGTSSGVPSTTYMDPKELQALDAPLIALTQQCGGDLRRLMFAYFSFLHRRTDFYFVPHPDDIDNNNNEENKASMGFREGDAEKLLLAAFRQFPLRRIPKGQGGNGGGGEGGKNSTASDPHHPPAPSKPIPSSPGPAKKPSKEESSTRSPSSSSAPSVDSAGTKTTTSTTTAMEKSFDKTTDAASDSELRYTEEGLQVPVGNGGSTKRYKWTQTIEECTVLIGVPKALRGTDLSVNITASTVTVKSKNLLEGESTPTTFLEGTLVEKVRPDESTWSIEGGVVIVTLDKMKQTFWKTVIQGDEEIDTELVDNRRHIGEYDDATQAKIRKIIFDQEQYHKGGPTSDEMLGQKSVIPPLPPGVEYIDRKKLDEEAKKQKAVKD